jgi:hypothetical protein
MALKVEAINFSETLLLTYKPAECHNTEDNNMGLKM